MFTEFRDLFYPNGVQIVPPIIGELLTARGLAYWAMDDGTKSGGSGFHLCTHSFTLKQVELLCLVLAAPEGFAKAYQTLVNSSSAVKGIMELITQTNYSLFH